MVKKLVCVNNVLMIEVNLLCFKGLCLNYVDCIYPQYLTPCLPSYSRCSHFFIFTLLFTSKSFFSLQISGPNIRPVLQSCYLHIRDRNISICV